MVTQVSLLGGCTCQRSLAAWQFWILCLILFGTSAPRPGTPAWNSTQPFAITGCAAWPCHAACLVALMCLTLPRNACSHESYPPVVDVFKAAWNLACTQTSTRVYLSLFYFATNQLGLWTEWARRLCLVPSLVVLLRCAACAPAWVAAAVVVLAGA